MIQRIQKRRIFHRGVINKQKLIFKKTVINKQKMIFQSRVINKYKIMFKSRVINRQWKIIMRKKCLLLIIRESRI